MDEHIKWSKTAVDIGLIIADYEKQRSFYQDILGLRWLGDISVPGGIVHVFECGDTLLKLYELDGVSSSAPAAFGSRLGWAYITLNVIDIERLYDQLTAAGATVLSAISEFAAAHPLLPPVGEVRAKVCMIADAEGNHIELLERY